MDEISSIEGILTSFRNQIADKKIEDYSSLFYAINEYMKNKRKRDFHNIPTFLIELDNTLEDISEHLKKKKDLIRDNNLVTLIATASNLGTSLSVMSNYTMLSTDPNFFERVSNLKDQINKISEAMTSILIAIGVSGYRLSQDPSILQFFS